MKVIILARVSSEEQDSNAQLIRLKKYCEGEVRRLKGPYKYGHCKRKPKFLISSNRYHYFFSFCISCARRYETENN